MTESPQTIELVPGVGKILKKTQILHDTHDTARVSCVKKFLDNAESCAQNIEKQYRNAQNAEFRE